MAASFLWQLIERLDAVTSPEITFRYVTKSNGTFILNMSHLIQLLIYVPITSSKQLIK